MASRTRRGPSVISLYTGVGGLDFGLEAAGFRTAVALEIDPTACSTLRLNRDWPLIADDIHGVNSHEILKVAGLKVGEADLLVGGPPCQPFSKSGYWARGDSARLDDPRADTLSAFLRVLRDAKPRVFLIENVPGLAFRNKDEGLQRLVDGVAQINAQARTRYSLSWQIINTADYGVPQIRERLFLVGSRDGATFQFPLPSHGRIGPNGTDNPPYKTAWDAIADISSDAADPSLTVAGKWGDLLPTIPEGNNYLWHTRRGGGEPLFGWRTRYWSFLLKLAKNKPAWTIQAQPGTAIGPFHWRNRRLTADELCRLQTFPDRLRFRCGRTEVQKLLGNAVPSLITEILGREIRTQLLGHRKAARQLLLIPPSRGAAPPPEPVLVLPAKYRVLIGQHADHPGEGLGNRARKRLSRQPDLFADQSLT